MTNPTRFSPVEMILSDVSPVIGAHIGPGVLAIAYMAGDDEAIPASGLLTVQKANEMQIAVTGEPANG